MASLLEGSLATLAARSRRRPARYSPELSASAQQQSEMCGGGGQTNAAEEAAAQVEEPQPELPEEEAAELDMAPAAKRVGRPRGKRSYKKRQAQDSKRPRVANVLLENEMIIDEIRVRKALWMRTHEQHHSNLMTMPLWDEVAKALDTTPDNIRRRWKSLKDHYRRELKKSMTDATAPPSTWPYYKKMRFMKSQMFVSLRRKNGEDHLEILSDDEEDINNAWNGHEARKQENGSDTMDDYELTQEYHEMFKYEQQHIQQLAQDEMDGQPEEEAEEDDEQQQQQQEEEEQEGQMEEQEELSPIATLQDQEELSAAIQQQQANLSELADMSAMQQQPVITSDMSTMTTMAGMVDEMSTIVTTTASSLTAMQQAAELSGRISAMQQRASELDALQRNADITARHSAIQQQHADINGRLSAMQRGAEMGAIQQRAEISAMHERAEMTALQQRARLQQRNGVVGGSNLSNMIVDDRGGVSDDYHFFMSLIPHVRHFSSLQKLKVRNRIQQIIIEEASNCQYDPLANC